MQAIKNTDMILNFKVKEREQGYMLLENKKGDTLTVTNEDVIDFFSGCKVDEKTVKKNTPCNLQTNNNSLASQKAVEYAKVMHEDEYNDPSFAPDVEQTIRDFQSGFITAMQIVNNC